MTKNAEKPRIIANSQSVFEKGMPFQIVHYPNQYGAFICYSESYDAEVYFCSCNTDMLEKAVLMDHELKAYLPNPIILSNVAPVALRSAIKYNNGKLEHLNVMDGLCHRCNLSTPTVRYKHEMYGGLFSQYYGWYIKQQKIRLGVSPDTARYLGSVCPENVQIMIEDLVASRDKLAEYSRMLESAIRRYQMEGDVYYEAWSPNKEEIERMYRLQNSNHSKLIRRIDNYFENIVRQEFGMKKIGESWVGETIMHGIIKCIYPTSNILRHYRPEWLGGLELDVFVVEGNIGFEYQGQQHYKSIKVWGGEVALKELQIRDARKRKLCREHNVRLIEISYSEPLTMEHLLSKIHSSK